MNQVLQKELNIGKISHAYLLEGSDTEYIIEQAQEFSKNIFNNDNLENNPDFNIIYPDDKTLKIEQIRDLQKNIVIKPIKYGKKIYIIDKADKMTEQSQNCILKTLEEPPAYAIIILIVTSAEKLIGTILSRVRKLKIEPEENNVEKEFPKICEIIDNKLDTYELLKYADYLVENKDDITDIFSFIIKYCEKKIRQSVLSGSQKNDMINSDNLIKIIENAEDALGRLKRNCNFNMVIDKFLISIADN